MAYGFDTAWVIDPPDVAGAGYDEWSRTTGIPPTHPLVGGPGWGNLGSAASTPSGLNRVVGNGDGGMPGGAPADPGLRPRWNDWRELFDPHSPMMWLLLLALAAVSLVHVRLAGRAGPARVAAGLG